MWTTLFVLAIAVNFEPTRVALVAFMLTSPRPIRQLLTFVGCGVGVGAIVGLLVLFVLDHDLLSHEHFSSAKIQIGIGAVLILGAIVVISNISLRKSARNPAIDSDDDQDSSALPPSGFARLHARMNGLVHGEKTWFSGAAGIILGLPSVEYLALLALIVSSDDTPVTKSAALFTFLFVANAVSIIPLFSYFVAPVQTNVRVQRFNEWIRSRTRRQAGAFLGTVGICLMLVGVNSL